MEISLCSLQIEQSSPGSFFWVCWAKETNIIKGNELLVINYNNWLNTVCVEHGAWKLSQSREVCHPGKINGVSVFDSKAFMGSKV